MGERRRSAANHKWIEASSTMSSTMSVTPCIRPVYTGWRNAATGSAWRRPYRCGLRMRTPAPTSGGDGFGPMRAIINRRPGGSVYARTTVQ